jgi:hypothetical protein
MGALVLQMLPVLLAAANLCSAGLVSDTRGAHEALTIHELSMEITALETLQRFDFNTSQLQMLRKIASETIQPAGARQAVKCSPEFRQVLLELRAALEKPDEAEKINKLEDRLEELRDSENPDIDDGWEVSDAARAQAPEVFRLLSARQVVACLSSGEDFTDPRELLAEAIDKVRGLDEKEWKLVREIVAEEVSRQVCGLDAHRGAEVGDKAVQLLIQVRAMKDQEFTAQREELRKAADEVVGKVSSLDVIRHSVECSLAELLSNPRLSRAIAAMTKK